MILYKYVIIAFIIIFIILFYIKENKYDNKNILSQHLKKISYYIEKTQKKEYNYILSNHITFFMNPFKINVYFFIKKSDSFCNKKKLHNLLKKYKSEYICPSSYTFPEDYEIYSKQCKNTKIILKSNAQRQEGIFISSIIQPKQFILNQKFINDCVLYKNHKTTFRLYLFLFCHKTNISAYTYNNGLIYYNNKQNNEISSFYGSKSLYDKMYPITIQEFENETNIILLNLLVSLLSRMATVIKKDQSSHYSDNTDIYTELFGVDFIVTQNNSAYILEINSGPEMESYCDRDNILRVDMLKCYIDIVHGKINGNVIKI